jgi:hypothetical protein
MWNGISTSSTPTPMTPPLLSLPNEVQIEKFSYLRPRDIAACQRSCRQLNDTVIHSQLLRYLIRVGRSGLHDPMLPGYSIARRIEALEKWEAAWSNLEMIESPSHVKYVVPSEHMPRFASCTLEIHDDFLIKSIRRNNIRGYAYIDLRTFQLEVKKDPWTNIANESWRHKDSDFVFFVEQDLALVIL